MYDYVIVGAGSAGCVLAGRLSADPSCRVLLLEAGPTDVGLDLVQIPAAFSWQFKSKLDWDYLTEPQEHLAGQPAYWPRGRVLGGCSSMNAMIYIRGHRSDYDRWRDEHGAVGWGWDDVLPYFLRAEDQQRGPSDLHATGGPLRVEDRRWTHPASVAFVEACQAVGIPANADFNGEDQFGTGFYQVTQRRGRRWSAASGYLHPAMRRSNLTVLTDALATRVVVEGGRAVAVEYLRGGRRCYAGCDGEVLLSGGAVNSPQLLLLSGIGPATHLRELGIEVQVDLPGVGENLHDHPAAPVLLDAPGVTTLETAGTPRNLLRWNLRHDGPLSSNVGESGAFVDTVGGAAAPNVQFHFAPAPYIDHGISEPKGPGVTLGPTVVEVASRGRLWLRSADPRWKPAIDPGYYREGADLTAMVEGLKLGREIAAAEPLARLVGPEAQPGPGVVSEEDLRDYARHHTFTLYHPVGTCAMGTGERAVVGPDLRVHGVAGLRVIDASVMPVVPRGNTNAPTIMVAEKAVDLVLHRPAPTPLVAVA